MSKQCALSRRGVYNFCAWAKLKKMREVKEKFFQRFPAYFQPLSLFHSEISLKTFLKV